MARYLIRRLFWAAVLFIIITLVTYVVFFLIPQDPAKAFAGKNARPEDVERAKKFLGLDDPVVVQYWHYLVRLVTDFDMGFSFASRRQVTDILRETVPVTASLVFGGAIAWMTLAMPIGILSALRPRTIADRLSMGFVLVGVAAHPVWLGLIFLYFIGYKAGLAPLSGYCDFFSSGGGDQCGGPVDWAHHLMLPWITFAILFAALYVRMLRATVMETMSADYVRTAKAKGAPFGIVLRHHVLRNALLPVVTMFGMDIGLALGGAIFTETVYSLDGIGKTAVNAIAFGDLPVIQGVVVFGAVAVIVFNFIVDLLYAWVDPRIRLT